MRVSVIIPIYNAEKYIDKAVKSAINQDETSEIILINDGSTDNSSIICKILSSSYSNVRLFYHEGKKNKGAGASRNLGIINSKYEYISFLDADDFYLPGRFSRASELFRIFKYIDGVYGVTGIQFENEYARQIWHKKVGRSIITAINEFIPHEELFETLLLGKSGYFTTDAVVVKKSLFDRTGLFDEDLRLHQDTAMWIKMAAVGSLIAESTQNPIAIRRVHDNNRILQMAEGYDPYLEKMYANLCEWGYRVSLPKYKINLLEYVRWQKRLFNFGELRLTSPISEISILRKEFLRFFLLLILRLFKTPSLILDKKIFKYIFEQLLKK